MKRHKSRCRATRWTLMVAALILVVASVAGAAGPEVRVVTDRDGQKLQVDGEDYLVFGMNWGYMPIGQNYLYDFWGKPDDVIETALRKEMGLLQDMGVNSIRLYVGIPPRWVEWIYDNYGITTMLNHTVGRYGYTIDGAWVPTVDYSDPRFRELVAAEIVDWVEHYKDTRGVLLWLLGNENNYGLHWSSFEIEALPENEREYARARYLYSLYAEITDAIKKVDPERLVSICNGDLQYIDIIAKECKNLDVLGTNVYRGISVRDMYQEVDEKLGVPVLFTEFGADAYNAKDMREDQMMQAKYLIGQWQEIYEQSHGKGRVGNAVGGYIFQWSDGWWKYLQDSRLDIHDTNASWPNGGYIEDYVPGENNMNEEWWGICAKGPADHRTLYDVYPRAAYYALRAAFELDPYAPDTDLDKIREHFSQITPAAAELEARGDKAALQSAPRERVHLSGLRLEFETFNTGGEGVTTPDNLMGFDRQETFYIDFEAKPVESLTAGLSLFVPGNVPSNPIDEIFYEDTNSVIYQSSISWDDRWFMLDGFYRTGHLHWKHEGDFFGLYRDAYYGENIDIYDGRAPVGFEIAGKRQMEGLKLAFGPQLWWGANPALFLKYNRRMGDFDATVVYHEDVSEQLAISTSNAIPLPKTRKASLQFATQRGDWGFEAGGLWSGSTKVGDPFQIAKEEDGEYRIYEDEIQTEKGDVFGGKAKVTWQKGPYNWYAQGARMGLVADSGPDPLVTFTGWTLKDSGSGNQTNFMTGFAYSDGDIQVAPNFLWQKPIIGPISADVPSPGRPRNVLTDPFAVLGNRETVGFELLFTYDPTPGTWFWAWDNDVRENSPLAASLNFIFRHQPTTRDVTNFIAEDGETVYSFGAAPPATDLWHVNARVVSKIGPETRVVSNYWVGKVQPNGWSADGDDPVLDRTIERFGVNTRVTHKQLAVEAHAKFNDWGPYDYHRDFNLTYPLQVMGDVSYSLGSPVWFGFPQTKIGVRGTWRSLDENSNRFNAATAGDDGEGSEWEFRTYVHVAL